MKKTLSILAILIAGYSAYAQNTFPSIGKVGIGTLDPAYPLSVQGNAQTMGLGIFTQSTPFNSLVLDATSSVLHKIYSNFPVDISLGSNYSTNQLYLKNGGNTGIGTDNPQSKLHIYQSTADLPGLIIQGNTINTDFAKHYIALTLDGDYGNATGNYSQIRSYSNLYNNWGSELAFYTTTNTVANKLIEQMRINESGNVGIGTSTPDAKLAVNGTIHAKEIKVDLNNWPDYVFKPDYSLPTLKEVETYIHKKQHLPDVPSAQEVSKNGLDLGNTVKIQMHKIEELTLYLIEKDKQLDEQQKKNEQEDARIATLEKLVIKLIEAGKH